MVRRLLESDQQHDRNIARFSRRPDPAPMKRSLSSLACDLSDAASGFVIGINALDHDTVVERTEFHAILLGLCDCFWIGSRDERVLAVPHISL